MALYSFKYHGVSNEKAVFSFKSETREWHHFKMDSAGIIKKIHYNDADLAQCNSRVINNLFDIIEESKSNSITEITCKGLLDTLIERDVHLDGVGSIAFHEYKIILPYKVKMVLVDGREMTGKYDGANEEEAISAAKLNNPLCVRAVIV